MYLVWFVSLLYCLSGGHQTSDHTALGYCILQIALDLATVLCFWRSTSDRTGLGYCIVFLAVTTLIGGVAARKKRKTGTDYLLIIISHE